MSKDANPHQQLLHQVPNHQVQQCDVTWWLSVQPAGRHTIVSRQVLAILATLTSFHISAAVLHCGGRKAPFRSHTPCLAACCSGQAAEAHLT